MTAALMKGQNGPLATDDLMISVHITVPAELSALLVTDNGTVRCDADFVFFNQPTGPGVRLQPEQAGQPAVLVLSLAAVPAEISQVRAVLTLDDPDETFGRIPAAIATVADAAGNRLYEYRIDGLDTESIVIALEVYRRQGAWKVRAVGQGYAGGFAALVTDHGVTVDEEPATAAPGSVPAASAEQNGVRTVQGEEKLSLRKREQLDLRKREVVKVLLEKDAHGVSARVVLVIDKTGSMRRLYRTGVVQRVVERMIPVAIQLDDDGRLEPYLYAVEYAKLPDISVDQAEAWCTEYLHLGGTHGGIDYDRIGGVNDEIPIMREVISTLRRGAVPTLVLFFTDGGFREKAKITQLMREAAELPAFWQFIGLGEANYGCLRKLDAMDGRIVDNAGFFAVDDIDTMTDTDLYHQLLGEFPDWLRAAESAGILR
ncbi:vWA domain-containing protein [Nocardia sp. 004]|uniref:vWA domain-containing protein n=1 Tax=Nocardia sp. 004 TaxID=3385978 RepID=UPI0039A21DC3